MHDIGLLWNIHKLKAKCFLILRQIWTHVSSETEQTDNTKATLPSVLKEAFMVGKWWVLKSSPDRMIQINFQVPGRETAAC